MTRTRLPSARRGHVLGLHMGGFEVRIQINCHVPRSAPSTDEGLDSAIPGPPGLPGPGEFFVDFGIPGGALRPWSDSVARLASLALQHGIPCADVAKILIGSRGDPSGLVTGHDKIRRALSIPDLIGRVLAVDFLGQDAAALPVDDVII